LRKREVEMANRDVGMRRSAIVALLAVITAFAAPPAAMAIPGKSRNADSPATAVVTTVVTTTTVPVIDMTVGDASWADASWADASWAE
jgi:hypothetical protein